MSLYQALKLYLVDLFNVSREFFHLILGLVVYLIAVLVVKNGSKNYKLLLIPFIFAVLMEMLDLRDAFDYNETFEWLDSLSDIAITVSLPVITYLLFFKR